MSKQYSLKGFPIVERDVNDFDPADQEQKEKELVEVYATDDPKEAYMAIRDGGFMNGELWVPVEEVHSRDQDAIDALTKTVQEHTGGNAVKSVDETGHPSSKPASKLSKNG